MRGEKGVFVLCKRVRKRKEGGLEGEGGGEEEGRGGNERRGRGRGGGSLGIKSTWIQRTML